MVQRLTQMEIDRVDLVDKGANGRRFAIFKREEDEGDEGLLARIQKAVAGALGMADPEPVAKATRTFDDMRASAELNQELPEAYSTLQDAIWQALWAYGDNDQPLPLETRKSLVATDLDQFKAYVLALLDAGLTKRDWIAKVGRKVTGARLARLKAAHEALAAVIAEVDEGEATEKRDNAQEDEPVEKTELEAAIAKAFETALEPIKKDIAELKKTAPAATAAVGKGEAEGEGEVTLEGVVSAIEKLAERIEKVEKRPGEKTSSNGQDTEVAKRSPWAGIV